MGRNRYHSCRPCVVSVVSTLKPAALIVSLPPVDFPMLFVESLVNVEVSPARFTERCCDS